MLRWGYPEVTEEVVTGKWVALGGHEQAVLAAKPIVDGVRIRRIRNPIVPIDHEFVLYLLIVGNRNEC
jgi:hypothetical protein